MTLSRSLDWFMMIHRDMMRDLRRLWTFLTLLSPSPVEAVLSVLY